MRQGQERWWCFGDPLPFQRELQKQVGSLLPSYALGPSCSGPGRGTSPHPRYMKVHVHTQTVWEVLGITSEPIAWTVWGMDRQPASWYSVALRSQVPAWMTYRAWQQVRGAGQGLSSREGELDIQGSGRRRSQTHTLRGFEGHWRCLTSWVWWWPYNCVHLPKLLRF